MSNEPRRCVNCKSTDVLDYEDLAPDAFVPVRGRYCVACGYVTAEPPDWNPDATLDAMERAATAGPIDRCEATK